MSPLSHSGPQRRLVTAKARDETEICKGAGMTHPAPFAAGGSTLAHMMLLARSPERLLALRLAMSSAIGPTSVVLDAGCGSLASALRHGSPARGPSGRRRRHRTV